MARPKSIPKKLNPPPETAFFPKLKGKWHYVYSDGEKEWLSIPAKGQAPQPAGKFALVVGHSEVYDEGFQSKSQTGFSEPLSEPPSQWARVTWMQLADSANLIGFWGRNENGHQWSLANDDPEIINRLCEGRTYRITQKWSKVSSKSWEKTKADVSIAELANPPDWLCNPTPLLENSICKRIPFPSINLNSHPRRTVWWLRRNGCLWRSRRQPDSADQLVSTVHHFCPSPGFIVRIEMVVPFTAAEKDFLQKQTMPCTFDEYLERMRLSIAEFKDTPQQISDPESTETWSHTRINPVYDLYLHAVGAFHRLQALMTYEEAAETIERRALRMEWVAREAITLGEKSTLLFISPKIPVLRKREKMDESAGRPAKSARIRSAVYEIVVQHQDLKPKEILNRLRRLAHSGSGKIGWNDNEMVFFHETEENPQWSESTMLKEIRVMLKRLKSAG